MRHVALLRGINLGASRRVAMPELRDALTEAGFDHVRTYVQSGNVVLESDDAPDAVARRCAATIAERFGLDVEVVVRTRDDLADVVRHDPLGDVAEDPKRYHVTFLEREPDAATVRRLDGLVADGERLAARGRELYTWHPDGAARSRLWNRLAGRDLGVVATSRNWNTVRKLLEMADEG